MVKIRVRKASSKKEPEEVVIEIADSKTLEEFKQMVAEKRAWSANLIGSWQGPSLNPMSWQFACLPTAKRSSSRSRRASPAMPRAPRRLFA